MIHINRPVSPALAALVFALATAWHPVRSFAQVTALTATVTWESTNSGTAPLQGIAYDSDGNLYVCRGATKEVLVFRRTGGNLAQTPDSFVASATTSYPKAVAVPRLPSGATGSEVYVINGPTTIKVYDFSFSSNAATASAVTVPSLSSYTNNSSVEQLRFDSTGEWLYVTYSGSLLKYSSTTFYGPVSIVRVLHRVGGTWQDSGVFIAPRNNTPTKADPDPRNNQGQSHGLAVDPNGNIWVASDTDPMVWDGSATVSANTYKATYGKYARPIRFYQRVVADDGSVSFIQAAEIPLDNKIKGITVAADGTLYAAESIYGSGIPLSHRIYVYRGTSRVGFIDTATASTPIEDLQFLDMRPTDAGPTVQGKNGSAAYLQQWQVTSIPTPPLRTLQGRVTDALTGIPVAGAVVRLYNVASAPTGTDGLYSVSVPDSGVADVQNSGAPTPPDPFYILTASATGYRNTTISPLRIHASTTLDVTLEPTSTGVWTTIGETDIQWGLRRVNVFNGDTVPTVVAGANVSARRTMGNAIHNDAETGNNIPDTRVFFDVDDAFHLGTSTSTPMLLSVQWYDEGLQYDTLWSIYFDSASSITDSNSVLRVPRGFFEQRRSTVFYLPNANFGNRQTSGADFHISEKAIGTTYPLTVLGASVARPGTVFRSGVTVMKWTSGTATSMVAAPTVYDGIAYVGDSLGGLNAVDIDTGQLLTSFGPGGRVVMAGKVAGRPVVYLKNGEPHVCVLTVNGQLFSFDGVSGAPDWAGFAAIGDNDAVTSAVAAPAVYVDNSVTPAVVVIFAGINTTGGASLVRVRREGENNVISQVELGSGSNIASAPALAANGTAVMVGFTMNGNGHLLRALNGDSLTFLHDYTVTGEAITVPATLSGDSRTMLIGSSNGVTGHVFAANASNATPVWSAPIGPVESPLWVDYPANGAINADTVYVATGDSRLHALNIASGEERTGWPVRPPMGRLGGPLFTLGGDNIYVGSDMGLMLTRKSSPAGFAILSPIDPLALSTPVIMPGMDVGASASGRIAGQDVIVTTGADGKLYSIKVQP